MGRHERSIVAVSDGYSLPSSLDLRVTTAPDWMDRHSAVKSLYRTVSLRWWEAMSEAGRERCWRRMERMLDLTPRDCGANGPDVSISKSELMRVKAELREKMRIATEGGNGAGT